MKNLSKWTMINSVVLKNELDCSPKDVEIQFALITNELKQGWQLAAKGEIRDLLFNNDETTNN